MGTDWIPARFEPDGTPVLPDGTWDCFRVAVIGRNPLFPQHWRDEAWRSLPPAEAVSAVQRWQRWYSEVLAGGHADELARIAHADAAREIAEFHRELVAAAQTTLGRTNAWATRPAFVAARDRVLSLPVGADVAMVAGAARAYNRTVPHAYKRTCHVRVRNGVAPDPWLEEFFAWVRPYLDSGHGLHLWA